MEYKKLPVGISGWECYQCDTNGVVYGKRGKPLKPNVNCRGYKYVVFCDGNKMKTMMVHRIVASTFINNPDNLPVINHIDGNKLNNNADNLEWTTLSGNMRHAVDILGKMVGANNHHAVKVVALDKITGETMYRFDNMADAARYFTRPGYDYRKVQRRIWMVLSPKHPERHTACGYVWQYDMT